VSFLLARERSKILIRNQCITQRNQNKPQRADQRTNYVWLASDKQFRGIPCAETIGPITNKNKTKC